MMYIKFSIGIKAESLFEFIPEFFGVLLFTWFFMRQSCFDFKITKNNVIFFQKTVCIYCMDWDMVGEGDG